jgi:tRNA G18 (ribose-2'-O)-methylase SpoU
MNSNCESLNAGVSASILMYEVYNEQLRWSWKNS